MSLNPILVIDDEPTMRIALCEALTRSGYAVSAASSGYEALEKFQRQQFTMVITDVKMSKMNGLEVLREVKRRSPSTPVIMITAYGTVTNAVDAMKEGAFDYLLKPFSAEELEEVVKKAIFNYAGKTPLPKSSAGKKIITQELQLLKILDLAKSVALSKTTVLIQGESGTGKELLAHYIHQNSPRRHKPFIAVNCAALPDGLLESELFGHERGSFTGAVSQKKGKFELANGGTILLDEIGEMALPLQAKLLRVLQEEEIDRVGGNGPIPVDVRVIATTNKHLFSAVKESKFREDLFYRINVIPINLPPLRERPRDLPFLIDHFFNKYREISGKHEIKLSEEAILWLKEREWKGNVRELENLIERAVLLCQESIILPHHFFPGEEGTKNPSLFLKTEYSVKEMERELIFQTLEKVRDNRTKAAKILGISIRTLRNKLKEYREES